VGERHFNPCKDQRYDPMLCDFELPLEAMFYPVGFPLHLATNSRDLMEAAGEAWSAWDSAFDRPALEFRVVVQPEGELASAPTYRAHAGLLSFVADAHNFATADTRRLTAAFFLSQKTAADHALSRWLFLEAMAYMLLTQRYVLSLHAACIAQDGAGILLCGGSGAGKSTLSVACARAGFTFLSDDCTWILTGTETPVALGKPHQARLRSDAARHFPEVSGYPSRAFPNGKLSMEVPTSLLAGVHTARQIGVGSLVFLDRESGGPARMEKMEAEEAAARLLRDSPSYGPEVNAMHERTVGQLARLPAWRMIYATLEEAIALVGRARLAWTS
jgi:energy-coupling factor transporter ATP-binding protein EcfA2